MAINIENFKHRRVIRKAESLIFSKEDVKDAALTCSTEIECKNIDFGFTAEKTFHRSNSLEINRFQFYHDQNKIEISTSSKCSQPIKMEIKYSSICKLDFEIYKIGDKFDAKLIINVVHPPNFGVDKGQGNWPKYIRMNPIEDDRDRPFWRQFIQSTAFRCSFNLDKSSELCSLLNQLYQNIPCGVTFDIFEVAAVNSMSFYDLGKFIQSWDWNIRYDLECIKQCGTKGSYFIDYVFDKKERLADLTKDNARELLEAMYNHLQADPSLTTLEFKEVGKLRGDDTDDNYVLIKTVYVTPTRVIATKEDWTMDSRGLRYIGIDNAIQIKFRDENLSWFPHDLAGDIITPTCRNGIVIADRVFFEFGGSNSLFRECGTYFCAAKNKKEILKKIKKLGKFESATAAKMSARIGQYFTSALKTRMPLKQTNVLLIDDILSKKKDSAEKHFCFTDGNGIMSYALALQIKNHLEIPYMPSAFQIRYAGYKGMLTVAPPYSKHLGGEYCPLLVDNDGPYFALFRKSQKKFHVKGDELLDFDVVQWSAPAPFNLYRSFISTLDYLAYKDIKQHTVRQRLRELNNETCFNIIKPLIDNQAFLDKLEKLPTYCPISKMENKNLMNEPFWRGMVEASVVEDARLLASKMQLPLPASLGRTAFGVADYTGKLKENQVFFQYSKTLSPKSKKQILVQRVGVTRSPIVHPGDIRFYQAVDIPELHHLVDVLVFPTVGARPHPDEIGGGDLDGDPYGVFWDEDLMLDKNFKATDFGDIESENASKIDVDQLQEEFPKFRSEYLEYRTLEHQSNCLLALSLTQDIDSGECRSMRQNIDKAVNYAKSGIRGRILKEDEKQFSWPTFMCKEHEPAYKTSHILCELHEKASTFYQMIQNMSQEAEQNRNEDAAPVQSSIEQVFHDFYDSYKKQIQTIMTKHQIENEGELFSNSFASTSGTLGKQKLPLINGSSDISLVQTQIHQIFKNYRSKLLDILSEDDWRSDMEAKNEHILTYKLPNVSEDFISFAKNFYQIAQEDKACYSFPWLLWEGLDAWRSKDDQKSRNFLAVDKINRDFHEIGGSLVEEVLETIPVKRRIRERTPSEAFNKMVKTWAICEKIEVCAMDAEIYFHSYLTRKNIYNGSHTVTGCEVFLSFLMKQMQNQNDTESKKELQKAAQLTLMKLAFLLETNIFKGIISQQQVVQQQCIVVSVPKNWANEFEENHKILGYKSGCEDVAVGVRKTFGASVKFSVMFRGSSVACERLREMLTPIIKVRHLKSMNFIKKHITEESNNLLMEIFDFQEPLQHSSSAPGRLISARSNRTSQRRGRR